MNICQTHKRFLLNYRSDIDGLRAVAVGVVVLYHAGFEYFPGGFVGVDIFFVISGYLITSILASERVSGSLSIVRFYQRRVLRLFPALFLVLLLSSLAAVYLLLPQELEDFGETLATTALFSSNFMFASEAGYFEADSHLMPLLHTWSLAIEEQFYLLFPLVILLAPARRLVYVVLMLFICSFVISSAGLIESTAARFYLLPGRAWELMLGALVTLLPVSRVPALSREFAGWLGLFGLIVAVTQFDSSTEFPGFSALLPCIATALIISAGVGREDSYLGRVLSVRPLVFLGLISYSLYLWHWPVLVFAKHFYVDSLSALTVSWLLLTSVVLAWLSWRFVEKPFRVTKFTKPQTLLTAALTMVLFMTIGLVFDQTKGLPTRLPQTVLELAAFSEDKPPERKHCEGFAPAEVSYDSLCRIAANETEPTFAVWGDSHAMIAMPAVRSAAESLGLNGLYIASNGCVPLLGVDRGDRTDRECSAFAQAALAVVAANPQINTIILVARWAGYTEGRAYGREDVPPTYLRSGGQAVPSLAANHRLFEQHLKETLVRLTDLGRKVIILGSTPEIGVNLPSLLAKTSWQNVLRLPTLSRAAHLEHQAYTSDVLQRHADSRDVVYIDPTELFCFETECQTVNADGQPLFIDDNHLSHLGVERLIPLFHDILARAGMQSVQ